jgi:cytochrome c biogenesis protein
MRTALLLLFLLALASVPGSFLPQRDLNPIEVRDYLAEHPTVGPLLDRVGMFDVFASPWFAAVYLLLFVSLIGCLSSRLRLHARALRQPPPAVPRVLAKLPEHERWESTTPAGDVLAAARRDLRRRRWRVSSTELPGGGWALSAEKGYLRETGNLLFHVSLVRCSVGIAMGGCSASRARCSSRRARASPTPSSPTTTSSPAAASTPSGWCRSTSCSTTSAPPTPRTARR